MFLIDNTKIQNSKIIDIKNRHYADLDFQFSTGFENDSSNFKLLLNNVENTLYGFTNQGNITFAKVDFSFVTKEIQTVAIKLYHNDNIILDDSIEVHAVVSGGSPAVEPIKISKMSNENISYVLDAEGNEKRFKTFLIEKYGLDTSGLSSVKSLCYYLQDLKKIGDLNTSNSTDFSNLFYYCLELQEVGNIDTSKGELFSYMFYRCNKIKQYPTLDLTNGTKFDHMFDTTAITYFDGTQTGKGKNFTGMFASNSKIATVVNLNVTSATELVSNNSPFDTIFANCFGLKDISFIGEIQYSIKFNSTKVLTKESLLNILNHLADLTGKTSQTLTLSTESKNLLSEEEKAIATNKNWVIA